MMRKLSMRRGSSASEPATQPPALPSLPVQTPILDTLGSSSPTPVSSAVKNTSTDANRGAVNRPSTSSHHRNPSNGSAMSTAPSIASSTNSRDSNTSASMSGSR